MARQMRVVLAREPGPADVLEVVHLPCPEPGPGEALLRVMASGVCFHDVLNRRGAFPRTTFPAVLGHEVAGVVEMLGPDVPDWLEQGMRVTTIQNQPCSECALCMTGREALCRQGPGFLGEGRPGGYAEQVVVAASSIVEVPDDIPDVVAATLACTAGTALHALDRAHVAQGMAVLVTAASGGVGTQAVQLARALGAAVIAHTSSEGKVARLKALGISEVVVGEQFSTHVKELSAGIGVDTVIEIAGQPTFAESLRCLRPGGTLVFVGNVSGEPVEVAPALTILKELSLLGSVGCTRAELRKVIGLVQQGQLEPVVSDVLPLERARDAHERLESRAVFGRIVLTP